jgi:hypothetical protein
MSEDVQDRVDELLARQPEKGEEDSFSHFNLEDNRRGSKLASELSSIAAEDGADAAVTRAYEVADEGDLGVAKYALKLFVTHDMESARELTIPSPEIESSEPLPPADSEPFPPAERYNDEDDEVGA